METRKRKILEERASTAFSPEFRSGLKRACDSFIADGKIICPSTLAVQSQNCECNCPEGVLIGIEYPFYYDFYDYGFGFTTNQHKSFQAAFDLAKDDGTPEAALGLLYLANINTKFKYNLNEDYFLNVYEFFRINIVKNR